MGDGAQRPTVVVVGGGIAGLAAAWELTGGAVTSSGAPHVVVLEAGGTLGGKLRAGEFEGGQVDLGPDGFLGRRPEAADLCREVGLGDELAPIGASGAAIWVRGRRRPLPEGLALGVPTRFWPLARSRILGLRGTARLLVDVLSPRPDVRGPLGDRAIGPLVARKLGNRVVEYLVDPLVGGIHAGSVSDMSTAAVFPLLLAVAQRRGSFMRSLRRAMTQSGSGPSDGSGTDSGPAQGEPGLSQPEEAEQPELAQPEQAERAEAEQGEPELGEQAAPGAAQPAFWALRGGMGSLVDALARGLTARGAVIRTSAAVDLLDRGRTGEKPWVLHTTEGPVVADGVVLAVPAPTAATLLAPHDGDAASLLRGIDHASVAVVTLSYPGASVPETLEGTGLLVPRTAPAAPSHTPQTPSDRTMLVTACTYLWQKWPHLGRPGSVLLRASVGRYGDERHEALDDPELVARVVRELEVMVGTQGAPNAWKVTRWAAALPQYRVHHLLRVTGIEAAVKRLPALAVAGAAYRGVGIPACVASGRTAARAVLTSLATSPSEAGPPK